MIARINLLPWRQRRLDRQRRVFLAQLGIVAAGSAFLVCLIAVVLDSRTGSQAARNEFLLECIDDLERRIDEIEVVRRRGDETLERVRMLSGLQRDRTNTVRIFDELARTIAPGVHYTSLVKRGMHITALGLARSNNDISTLMRNIQESERFEAPRLKGIEEVAGSEAGARTAVFELTFATSAPTHAQ